jgi:hypothetical protein
VATTATMIIDLVLEFMSRENFNLNSADLMHVAVVQELFRMSCVQ